MCHDGKIKNCAKRLPYLNVLIVTNVLTFSSLAVSLYILVLLCVYVYVFLFSFPLVHSLFINIYSFMTFFKFYNFYSFCILSGVFVLCRNGRKYSDYIANSL